MVSCSALGILLCAHIVHQTDSVTVSLALYEILSLGYILELSSPFILPRTLIIILGRLQILDPVGSVQLIREVGDIVTMYSVAGMHIHITVTPISQCGHI